MIRILIADRHACTRAGYRSYLSGSLRGAHVGEAVTSGDVLKQLVENAWDLLMLDVEFVAQSNFRLLEEVRSVRPTMRILVTSGLSDAQWERWQALMDIFRKPVHAVTCWIWWAAR